MDNSTRQSQYEFVKGMQADLGRRSGGHSRPKHGRLYAQIDPSILPNHVRADRCGSGKSEDTYKKHSTSTGTAVLAQVTHLVHAVAPVRDQTFSSPGSLNGWCSGNGSLPFPLLLSGITNCLQNVYRSLKPVSSYTSSPSSSALNETIGASLSAMLRVEEEKCVRRVPAVEVEPAMPGTSQ